MYCCWRATISAILKLLFALFYYYSTIILLLFWLFYRLYALYAKQKWRCRWVFIVEIRHKACQRCWTSRRTSLWWSSSSIIFLHDHPPLSNGWTRCLVPRLCSICCLDVLQPTIAHGLTKTRAQVINLLGDGESLVLPHVIRKAQFRTDLKSQNNLYN